MNLKIKSFPNNSGGICKNSLFRRLTMSSSSSKSYYGNVGDAVFYDSSSNSFVFLPASAITSKVDSYTPIGVVAIPTSHDVYGTGECGVISLAEMNYGTPDTGGSSYQTMYWGGNGTDTSLLNFGRVNYIGTGTTLNDGAVQGTYLSAFLPSDQFSTVVSLDGKSGYYGTNAWVYQAPSPFNADGSRNEAYYTTAYSTANALSDFDGIGNTDVLTKLSSFQSDWKTSNMVTNRPDPGCYPAACCTWRFHTAGTEQGQWYLPACGELGYVTNSINTINTTIIQIKNVYTSVIGASVDIGRGYWSSTEYNNTYSRICHMPDGNLNYLNKYDSYCVRAFLRL